jgi:peptidoglycan endopeptidase LytE
MKRSAALIEGSRTMSAGDRNSRVRRAQEILFESKYYDGPLDGRYGVLLSKSVRRFQQDHDLSVTGDINPATWAALVQ